MINSFWVSHCVKDLSKTSTSYKSCLVTRRIWPLCFTPSWRIPLISLLRYKFEISEIISWSWHLCFTNCWRLQDFFFLRLQDFLSPLKIMQIFSLAFNWESVRGAPCRHSTSASTSSSSDVTDATLRCRCDAWLINSYFCQLYYLLRSILYPKMNMNTKQGSKLSLSLSLSVLLKRNR